MKPLVVCYKGHNSGTARWMSGTGQGVGAWSLQACPATTLPAAGGPLNRGFSLEHSLQSPPLLGHGGRGWGVGRWGELKVPAPGHMVFLVSSPGLCGAPPPRVTRERKLRWELKGLLSSKGCSCH